MYVWDFVVNVCDVLCCNVVGIILCSIFYVFHHHFLCMHNGHMYAGIRLRALDLQRLV